VAGVAGVTAFLGVNGGQPDATGIQLADGNLGLVLAHGGYALSASGGVELVGLDGLSISGSFAVRANKTGQLIDETVMTPAGPVIVRFDSAADVMSFGGQATLSVAGVFELSGAVNATKVGSGTILVDVPEMDLKLKIRDTEVFDIGGKARFGIGGGRGFQLLDIGLTRLTAFGVDVSAIAGALPSFAMPDAATAPAQLATIVDGVDLTLLNRRKYLDIAFNSPTARPLDAASILDTGAEFTLSGGGVGDAVVDRVEQIDDTTFRYYLRDRDPSNDIDLFREGSIHVTFNADSWSDADGVGNVGTSDDFTTRAGGAKTSSGVALGPLTLQGQHFELEDFQFKPLKDAQGGLAGAQLIITVGLGVDHAGLNFGGGQSSSGIRFDVNGLSGLFDVLVNLDVPDCLSNITSNPFSCVAGVGLGKFRIEARAIEAEIPGVFTASAHGVIIQYAPEKDKDADGSVNLGSILQLDDIRAGVTDFGVVFGQGVVFNGEIFIASGGAELLPGKPFATSIKDGPDANTEAVRASLSFRDGRVQGFKFAADKLSMKFGSFLTISGEKILINTDAGPNEYVASFDSIGAEVTAGPLKIGGKMRRFAFTGGGQFVTLPGFGVVLSADDADPASFKWPSWLPIRLTKLGIEWRDIQSHCRSTARTGSRWTSTSTAQPRRRIRRRIWRTPGPAPSSAYRRSSRKARSTSASSRARRSSIQPRFSMPIRS
ncbi:MAG TPA: hypothetical protein PLV92_03060, partial [Pirellulaceae bacterium]|nr:hypothetical protein [Pirellulaceae bacterium]